MKKNLDMLSLNSKNFFQNISKDKVLLGILLIGLLLRALNPTFGSPSLFTSNDEAVAHQSAFNMLAAKTPVSIANYTPLGAWLQIPFLIASFLVMKLARMIPDLRDFELFLLTHEGYFLFIPRLLSALFGTLTILVIYKLTLLLFHLRGEKNLHLEGDSNIRNVALIAAALTAVSFNSVHISHFGRPWAAALFFFVLAIYLAIRAKYTLAYLAVAISFGFHQAGIFAAPLIFWLTKRRLSLGNLANIVVMVLLFLIFSLLTLKIGLVESIKQDQSFLKAGKLLADIIVGNQNLGSSLARTINDNLIFYFGLNLLITDGVLLLFGVLGIIKSNFRESVKKKLIVFLVSYFLFASLFFHPLLRYLLPIILLLIPFAAFGIYSIFKNRRFLIFLALLFASINSVWWNWLYLKTPTFIQAHRWITENVPKEVPVAYTGGRFQTFVPSSEAIRHIQTVSPNAYHRLESVTGDSSLDNVRNIVYVSKFPGRGKLEQLENATINYPVEYIIDYYLDDKERLYSTRPEAFEIVVQFKPTRSEELVGIPEPLFDASWNFPTNDKREKVSMYSLERIGPYFDVLKVRSY